MIITVTICALVGYILFKVMKKDATWGVNFGLTLGIIVALITGSLELEKIITDGIPALFFSLAIFSPIIFMIWISRFCEDRCKESKLDQRERKE